MCLVPLQELSSWIDTGRDCVFVHQPPWSFQCEIMAEMAFFSWIHGPTLAVAWTRVMAKPCRGHMWSSKIEVWGQRAFEAMNFGFSMFFPCQDQTKPPCVSMASWLSTSNSGWSSVLLVNPRSWQKAGICPGELGMTWTKGKSRESLVDGQ